jgi:hypothetical protein
MKTSEAVFVLHGDVERKSKLLDILAGEAFVVVWPDVSDEDAKRNLIGFDSARHTILHIGSKEKLYIGRNNIIDWCKEHNITRFWMLDDDIGNFKFGGPHAEYRDKIRIDGKLNLNSVEFEDDTGLGGMSMAGIMFNRAVDCPHEFCNRFIWAAVFIDLSINNIRYSIEGYDDIDMQLECIKNGIKTQTTSWLGHYKPAWYNKKSLNSSTEKIDYNNYLIYKKWGESTKIDIYYVNGVRYFRIHIRYPYRCLDDAPRKYNTDSLEEFVKSLETDYTEHPENFKVSGLPHMRGKTLQRRKLPKW